MIACTICGSLTNPCKCLQAAPAVLTPSQQGWKCPSCGNCYAPFVQECRVCNKPDMRGKAG